MLFSLSSPFIWLELSGVAGLIKLSSTTSEKKIR